MTAPIRRVLVLGGYGAFGRRLVELLAGMEELEVLVAGRSRDKAQRLCDSLDAAARLEPVRIDRDGDIGTALDELSPDLVVDASGPFQAYGRDPWRLVAAAIARGIHYADLADSADFVRGVERFDAAARSAGVFALSGLSTCPALTAAAVRYLGRDLCRIDSVVAGIAPSPFADVGRSVVKAVAGYAGRQVTIVEDGAPRRVAALTDHRKVAVGLPGGPTLLQRRFSLVDVPDLSLLRDCFPDIRNAWFGAAIAPPVLQRALTTMARLVHWRLLPGLGRFAGPMHAISNRLRWGENRSGMFVTVSGLRAESIPIERSWHLVAGGARGTYVPAIAAAAIIDRCNTGRAPAAGARPATGELEIEDFEPFFASLGIAHGVRAATSAPEKSLYRRVLGEAWLNLPASLRRLHGAPSTGEWRGRAQVTRGAHPLARLVCTLFRFPPSNDDVDVTIVFRRARGRETWIRSFAGRRFSSVQYQGVGRYDGLLCERFGPFTFGLGTIVECGRLHLPVRRWSMLGLPLPLALAPRSDACEFDEDGSFRFRVAVSLPWVGPLVRYEGCFTEELPIQYEGGGHACRGMD